MYIELSKITNYIAAAITFDYVIEIPPLYVDFKTEPSFPEEKIRRVQHIGNSGQYTYVSIYMWIAWCSAQSDDYFKLSELLVRLRTGEQKASPRSTVLVLCFDYEGYRRYAASLMFLFISAVSTRLMWENMLTQSDAFLYT